MISNIHLIIYGREKLSFGPAIGFKTSLRQYNEYTTLTFISLSPWMLGIFSCFCWPLLTFFLKLAFSNNSFRNTFRVSNSLDPDQEQHFMGPDLGPNCLQKMTKVTASKERVNAQLVLLNTSNPDTHGILNIHISKCTCVAILNVIVCLI